MDFIASLSSPLSLSLPLSPSRCPSLVAERGSIYGCGVCRCVWHSTCRGPLLGSGQFGSGSM